MIPHVLIHLEWRPVVPFFVVIERLRRLRRALPDGFTFDRETAHER